MSVRKGTNRREDDAEKKIPITIRIRPITHEAMQQISREYKLKIADIVRACIDNNLLRYNSNLKFLDYDQGAAILKEVTALFNECSEIGFQLKRIGVNFNQVARKRNIEQKYKSLMSGAKDFNTKWELQQQQTKELSAVDAECGTLDMDRLEELIARYEAATEKVSELLCPILR